MSSIGDCLFSSDSNKTSDLHNITSNLADEQCKKGHIDNISHIAVLQDSNNTNHDHPEELVKKLIGCNSGSSESLLEKNDPKEVQKQSIDDYNNSGSEDNHTNPIGNRTLILKNNIAYCPEDDNPCHNTDGSEDPRSSSNISSKAQICSDSLMSACLSHPLANVNGENEIADDDACKDDGKKTSQVDSLGSENCISGFKLQKAIKLTGSKHQPDRPNSRIYQMLLLPYFEIEASAETDDDIKVCDICGDVGEVELLAFCSRCSDGAEHIYCMQIMLAEVPKGEWLCEECQLKEAGAQVTGKFEAQVAPTEAPLCLEENSARKESSVENKTTDPDMRSYNKEPAKSISSKRKEENLEVNSVSKQNHNEPFDTLGGTIVPRKPSQFSLENFNKHDSVKIKPISSTICSKSEGISCPDSLTQTSSGLDSSEIQAPLQPTHGPLSKTNSFNNPKLLKVKQLLDNVPWKMKLNREANLTNKRNDSPSWTISKSASFGSETSGFSSVETSSKVHALSPPHSEDPKQVKGGCMPDKKNSTSDQRFVAPAVSMMANSNVQSCNFKVKVCDICGDAGEGELLAFCSRCSDGAEHIYCMRIMLAEVPEGEWLCEECQLKEAGAQVTGKFEAQVAPTEAPLCLEENSARKESSVENKTTDPDLRRYNKEPAKSISSKRKEENSEVNSVSKQNLNEAVDILSGTIVPRKPSQFSRENFNKHDSVKIKPISSTICSKSEGISCPDSRTQTTSGLDSSEIQAPWQPTHGPLSKTNSFNNPKLPKVKQLMDNVPWKMKLNREANLTNKRNDSLSWTISKSASFGSETLGFSSVETSIKVHALSPPHSEDHKQVKGGSMPDNKNSTSDQRFVTPAVSMMANSNVQSCNFKVSKISDLNNPHGNRGPIDATGSAAEVKKTSSASLSRTSGSQSVGRLCKNEDQKGFQNISKATDLTQRDVKAKGQISINSRQLSSVPNHLSRCHKCNEIGHTAQFCPVDKLRLTATKPSSERNLRDMDIRSIKRKNVIEGPAGKSGTKRKSPDQSEEVSLASSDINSEATTLYPSSKDLSSRITNVQNCSKAANTTHVKQVEDHGKFVNVAGEGTVLDFPDDGSTRTMAPTFPSQASTPIDLLRASAIPEMDYIWQGAFEVLSTAKPPTVFDGFQAHLSSDVSPKALEVAGQFPCKVQLEEVPRLSSWPLQFHENSPGEDNIAIFFFAKSIDSYENYYWKLLDNILKNDLALVGVIGAMQLLIFPSNLLPGNSQRWNNLFYLWGVFRRSQEISLGDLPGPIKRPSVFSLDMEPATQGLSIQTLSGVYTTVENQASSKSCTFPISNASRCSTCSDLQDIPASGKDNEVSNKEQALVKDTLHQDIPDEIQKKKISCSFPAAYSSRKMNQLSTLCVSRLEPKFQIDNEKLPPEVEDDIYCLDEFTSDPDCRKGHEHLVKSGSTQVGNCVEPSKLVSLDYCQGNDRNVLMLDHFSWESKPNLKCAHPSSLDTIENSSTDLLQPAGDTMLWASESTCTSLSDEKDHKKMRLDNGGHIDCSSREEISCDRLFPKIQSMPSSLPHSSLFNGTMSESSKNAENYFFHVNQGPTCLKADNVIYVSSDDDDSPKSSIPILKPALGEKRRIAKQEISRLQAQKNTERNNRDKLLVPDVVDGDAALTLLSLSLAFPASEKAQTAKPNSK